MPRKWKILENAWLGTLEEYLENLEIPVDVDKKRKSIQHCSCVVGKTVWENNGLTASKAECGLIKRSPGKCSKYSSVSWQKFILQYDEKGALYGGDVGWGASAPRTR